MSANADLITIGTYICIKGKQLTTSLSYMGQNVKNVVYILWLFGVCVWGGGLQ